MVSAIWVAARSWRRIYDTTYRSWPARYVQRVVAMTGLPVA
jgi:hypothetical protein